MHFSVVALLSLATIATAQNASSVASSLSSSVVSQTSSSLSPQATCLAACGTTDICCQARCVNVPCPSALQANATNECAARCPQGSGSKADTDQYAACQARCVSSYFFSSATAAATGSTGSGSSAAASATGTGSTASRSGSGTASATGASATQNAASEIRFGAAGAGLLALIVVGLAL